MLQNSTRIQITSADIAGALQMLENAHIALRDVKSAGNISVFCVINRNQIRFVHEKLSSRGDQVQILDNLGMLERLYCVLKRPVLVSVILMIVFLSIFLPTRILFVEVEGNALIPTHLILEQAAQSGISFGAARRHIRSEQVKNSILSAIPELEWIGVNTTGCMARISVKERGISRAGSAEERVVSNLVALHDGVITECVVRRGNMLCNVGQAVTAGEILVSGYTDCGLTVRATHVDAEISADTLHTMQGIMPATYAFRAALIGHKRNYSLQVGKKLINFFKDSGISSSTCVKMYTKKYIKLPGGLSLPVAIIIEDQFSFQSETGLLPDERCSFLLKKAVRDYLLSSMVSGRIRDSVTYVQPENGVQRLIGYYACNEMIGQVVYEENAYNYGENN